MFRCTKLLELGSCAFKQPRATSHCRHNHGYQLKAKFWFASKELDINHWVVNFGGLKDFKAILKEQFDHTTCLAFDDPHLDLYRELEKQDGCKLKIMPKGTGIERIAEWCYDAINKFLLETEGGRCECIKVEVFEHQDNSAIYEKNNVQASDLDLWSYSKPLKKQMVQPAAPSPTKEVAQSNPSANNNNTDNNPLYGKKQTNKWIDKDSTNVWGF